MGNYVVLRSDVPLTTEPASLNALPSYTFSLLTPVDVPNHKSPEVGLDGCELPTIRITKVIYRCQVAIHIVDCS